MMMQGIRKAGQGFLGKLVIAIMFGFLIISFAIWGVGDIFRGYGRNEVAKIGKTEISVEQVRNAYQTEIQNLIRQQRRQISPEMARALGLDRQVLSRLVSEGASLSISDTGLGPETGDGTDFITVTRKVQKADASVVQGKKKKKRSSITVVN